MPTIRLIDPIRERQIELDFADLVALIKGSSVKSLANAEHFFELGLSDAFNLRVQGIRPV